MAFVIKDEEQFLPAKLLRELLHYDSETGRFRWKPRLGGTRGENSFNARRAGKETGFRTKTGYIDICITTSGRYLRFRAHRVAWAYVTGSWPGPDCQIDHMNNTRSDNRFVNLRLADHVENCSSQKLPKNNTTGFKGVTYRDGLPNPWKAQISANGKKYSIGYYSDPVTAAKAHDTRALELFGEFARTNASMGLL